MNCLRFWDDSDESFEPPNLLDRIATIVRPRGRSPRQTIEKQGVTAADGRPNCLTSRGPVFIIEIVHPAQLFRSDGGLWSDHAPTGRTLSAHASRRLIIWIVILVLFIASLVAAYFGSRYWHWAHVTLLVFIFLAAVGYFVLAAETLRINAILRKQVNQLTTQVAQVNANIEALDGGTSNSQVINQLLGLEVKIPEDAEKVPSIGELEHQLHMMTRLRGQVWRQVAPNAFDPQTGTVQVTIPTAGLAANTVLFLFEEGPVNPEDPSQGAQYLGEFRVAEVNGQQVKLVTVNELDDVEKQRLANGRGPWSMYETMPADQLELFTGMTEEQLRKLLPEASVEEYLRQGTPATPDDDEWHVVGFDADGNRIGPDDLDKAVKKTYQRRLRDYATELSDLNRRRVLLLSNIEAVKLDNERLQKALASAKQLEAFRTEEIRKLEIDLTGVKKEREIIERHLSAVEGELAAAKKWLDQAIAENRRLADELDRREGSRSGSAPTRGPLAVSR